MVDKNEYPKINSIARGRCTVKCVHDLELYHLIFVYSISRLGELFHRLTLLHFSLTYRVFFTLSTY